MHGVVLGLCGSVVQIARNNGKVQSFTMLGQRGPRQGSPVTDACEVQAVELAISRQTDPQTDP